MKHCPRCGNKTMFENEPMNGLSRRDNATYICPNCSKSEAYIDAGMAEPDDIEKKFLAKIGKA